MITPSFGLTATERVLPKLALDFTTASLDSRITLTRTTGASNPATYVNSSGVVTAATNNQPRFDYDPVTLVCKGLLIEESRSNLLQRSEEFNDIYWTKSQTTVSQNVIVSPDGTQNADLVIPSTSSALHQIYTASITITSGASYTYSVYAKAGGYDWLAVSANDGAERYSWFNLSNGTLGNSSAGNSPSITPMGNGWYRCSVTRTAGSTNARGQYFVSNTGGPVAFAGDGTSGIYIWGAQLEAGAFATSYIPTTTTALTRNADVATMTGTNFSDWFNASEGTFYIEGSRFAQGTFAPFFSANNGTLEIYTTQVSNTGRAYINTDGALVCNGTWNTNAIGSMAFAYKANDAAGSFEGTTVVTDTSVTMFTADRLRFGNRAAGTNQLSGYLVKMSYWPSRLTNAEIQAFSK